MELSRCKSDIDIRNLKLKYKIDDKILLDLQSDQYSGEISKCYPESKQRGMVRAFMA